jgi:hypothetical protein
MHHQALHVMYHAWHAGGVLGVLGLVLGAGVFMPECDVKSTAGDPFGLNDPSACHSVLGSFPLDAKPVAEIAGFVVGGGLGFGAGVLLLALLRSMFPRAGDELGPPHG